MDWEKYKHGCSYLGWTAIAVISILVIIMFVFTILGFFLGMLGIAAIDASSSNQPNISLPQ